MHSVPADPARSGNARVDVSDGGVWVIDGVGRTYGCGWDDIDVITVYRWSVPPDSDWMVTMDVSMVNGEYLELNEPYTDGFAAAVAEISRRAGRPMPDLSRLTGNEEYELWRVAEAD